MCFPCSDLSGIFILIYLTYRNAFCLQQEILQLLALQDFINFAREKKREKRSPIYELVSISKAYTLAYMFDHNRVCKSYLIARSTFAFLQRSQKKNIIKILKR